MVDEKSNLCKKEDYGNGGNRKYMKATGMTRRIDDLGRIVIPKEIRRTLRIRESDPLEIFTNREDEIILKKYSPIGEMGIFAKKYAESLAQVSGMVALVSDRDQFIAVSGGMKFLNGKGLSKELEKKMEGREMVVAKRAEKHFLKISKDDDGDYEQEIICPIICEGDVIGSVILLAPENKQEMGDAEIKLIMTAANFLGKHMEQ